MEQYSAATDPRARCPSVEDVALTWSRRAGTTTPGRKRENVTGPRAVVIGEKPKSERTVGGWPGRVTWRWLCESRTTGAPRAALSCVCARVASSLGISQQVTTGTTSVGGHLVYCTLCAVRSVPQHDRTARPSFSDNPRAHTHHARHTHIHAHTHTYTREPVCTHARTHSLWSMV